MIYIGLIDKKKQRGTRKMSNVSLNDKMNSTSKETSKVDSEINSLRNIIDKATGKELVNRESIKDTRKLLKDRAKRKIESEIAQFNGTEKYYTLSTTLLYTEGAKFVFDYASASWLKQLILMSYRILMQKHSLTNLGLVVTLTVDTEKETGVFTAKDDNTGYEFVKHLDYTDFPLPEMKMWVKDNIILLPAEYWANLGL